MSPTPTIVERLDAYAAALRARPLSEKTVATYLVHLRGLARALAARAGEDVTLDAITHAALESYLAEQGDLAAKTRAYCRTAVRSFCRWCVAEGWHPSDPPAGLDWPRRGAPARVRRERPPAAEELASPDAWPWREHVAAYLASVSTRRRAGGVRAYSQVLGLLITYAKGAPPSIDLVEGWLASRAHCAPTTLAFAATVANSFTLWCARRGRLPENPLALLERPQGRRGDVLQAPMATVRAVAAWVDDPTVQPARSRRYVGLCLYAGLRISEARLLAWSDVDLAVGELLVRAEVGKGGKGRRVPLAPPLARLLAEVPAVERVGAVAGLPGGKPMSRGGAEHVFNRELARAGLDVTAHMLRRAFATELDTRGVSLRIIQSLLGHTSLATTERYLGIDNARKRAAVAALDGVFGAEEGGPR